MRKPRIFIGSSTEGHAIAENVFEALERDTVPVIWSHHIFLPGRSAMESLERELQRSSFAILVASPDDELVKRGVASPTMRDNVLVEFGLFAGALGRRRVFFVCPSAPPLELPSDLAGIVVATYDADRAHGDASDRAAAVQRACREIRDAIKEEWAAALEDEAQRLSQMRATDEFLAAQRLYRVASRLRDAVLFVQRDALAAFNDRTAFETVKEQACAEVSNAADSISTDAEDLGVELQVRELEEAATAALRDLPFPAELSRRDDDANRALNAGKEALSGLFAGRDPVQSLRESAAGETKDRLAGLNSRYAQWWEAHSSRVRDATMAMQDALMQVTLRIGMAQVEVRPPSRPTDD